MTTHLGVMILFASAVAVVFGTLLRDDLRAQGRVAGQILLGLVCGGVLLGWVMYFTFG